MTKNVTELDRWQDVDWKSVNASVKSLRQRIYVASQNDEMKIVSGLQKLMLRSRTNWLQAIRRVTQINRGRRTPGVDREIITTPKERLELFHWLEIININEWQPMPTRRVEIPKGGGKMRPLSMPIIRDRVIQAIVKNALEPYWEARFESISYGFRPGRSTHDAIMELHLSLRGQRLQWILDGDIKGAFDNINQDHLMQTIGNFPARKVIERWLKAGVMIGVDFTPTPAGTPQGGVISPLLANIALHGMEKAIGVTRKTEPSGGRPQVTSPVKVIRYADDFVVLAETEEDAVRAKASLDGWLNRRGLEMSEEKTSIIHIDQGFDFLGFTIKRYKSAQSRRGTVIHTRPSKKSILKFKEKVRDIFDKGKHKSPERILMEINPLITGWGLYFRTGVSKKTFGGLDNFIWHRCWRYAKRRHPKKGKRWVAKKYFTTHKGQKWTFYDEATGKNIRRMSHIPIERHRKVKYGASPDDPGLEKYWENRQRNPKVPTGQKWDLWKRQQGICPECKGWLDNGEELQVHHLKGRGDEKLKYKQLLHETCHDKITQGAA